MNMTVNQTYISYLHILDIYSDYILLKSMLKHDKLHQKTKQLPMKRIALFMMTGMLVCSASMLVFSQGQGLNTTEWAAQNPDRVISYDIANPSTGQSSNQVKANMVDYTYTYVGSYRVSDGGFWGDNPPCYTGQEAAAFIFGGNPEDYVISIDPNTTDPNTITFTAYLDGWGELITEYAQDYKLDLPPAGYELPSGSPTNRSAYVADHVDYSKINYVWLATPHNVPVSNWALGIGILLIAGFTILRFRRV